MQVKDEPAFPYNSIEQWHKGFGGAMLSDLFAAFAMQKLIANRLHGASREEIAFEAYTQAHYMLKERQRRMEHRAKEEKSEP
jgi:hypothetical protein